MGEYLLQDFLPKSLGNYTILINKNGFPQLKAFTEYPQKDDFRINYHFNVSGDLTLNWNPINHSAGYRVDIYTLQYGYYHNWEQKEWYWAHRNEKVSRSSNIYFDKSFTTVKNKRARLKIIIWAIDENYLLFLKFRFSYNPNEFHLIDFGNFSMVDNGLGYIGSAYCDSLIIEND